MSHLTATGEIHPQSLLKSVLWMGLVAAVLTTALGLWHPLRQLGAIADEVVAFKRRNRPDPPKVIGNPQAGMMSILYDASALVGHRCVMVFSFNGAGHQIEVDEGICGDVLSGNK